MGQLERLGAGSRVEGLEVGVFRLVEICKQKYTCQKRRTPIHIGIWVACTGDTCKFDTHCEHQVQRVWTCSKEGPIRGRKIQGDLAHKKKRPPRTLH